MLYTWFERCNGNAYCINRIDEKNCTNWWCNSNNGTFLCKNLNCIYETWVCDGKLLLWIDLILPTEYFKAIILNKWISYE